MSYKWYGVVFPDGRVFIMTAKTLEHLKRRLFPDIDARIIPIPVKGLQEAWWWLAENHGIERTSRPTKPPGSSKRGGIIYENLREGHPLLRREGPKWKRKYPATTGRLSLAQRIKIAKRKGTGVQLYPDELPPRGTRVKYGKGALKPTPAPRKRPIRFTPPPRPRTPPMEEIIR